MKPDSHQQRKPFAILLCATVFLSATFAACDRSNQSPQQQPSVYDRVIASRKIRAAYLVTPPYVMKDAATGRLSGVFVETLEKIGQNTDLQIEWTEEVGWDSQIVGLMANRYDIVGSPVWANPVRGKLAMLSVPLFYGGVGVWVRSDDNRFVSDLQLIDSPNVRIATVDGETSDVIARTDFPRAQRASLPQLADLSRTLLDVQTRKADVAFVEPYTGHLFLKANPGSVRNLAASKPIRIFGNCFMFRPNEPQLKHLLDVALNDLLASGYIDGLIRRYEPAPNTFYRVARPYQPVE